ncbi:DNA-directed RNA polymerase III subunit C1 (rpo31) [Tilletia horrida]|nr:DNA-directed RNA polymerase III subunit C1 (rpo31) [Tilletia horrida]
MKDLVVQDVPKKIKHIQFGVLSMQDIARLSELEVTSKDLYNIADRTPVTQGVLDRRMGVSDKFSSCATCGLRTQDCTGHFGYIKLVLPVFHIGFFKHIISILQMICKNCACVLIDEDQRRKYLRLFRRPNLENLQRTATFKAVNTLAKKVTFCPRCGALNGFVKKAGQLKIVHEKFRQAKKSKDEKEAFLRTFETAKKLGGGDITPHLGRAQDDMNPLKVLELFKRISDEDCELLALRPEFGRPEQYIWQYICVPPVCIRPSVAQDGATNEDDLTVKLTEIIFTNGLMKVGLQGDKGTTTAQLIEQWDYLQLLVAMYINSELPGVANSNAKPIRGFCQRLKGKQGRFRGNLSGKRVDFSGRTVISPDPNLKIDEVAVPERVAKILTYPDRVFSHNIEVLRQAIINGCDVHPGANYVINGNNGFKRFLKFVAPARRVEVANQLRIGDTVERHLRDGDIVLFNRQPSLHKLSIMSHRAKVRPWRTFRLNECACAPYNADFDGDEMNMHVPQTEEARTEATILMGVKHNLVTPKNGEPVIAAIQDFITASYLLSKRDRLLNRAEFVQICSYFADADMHIDIPPPTILKPQKLWTGKQVFSVLIRPNKASKNIINLEAQCKKFEKPAKGAIPDMSPNDGFLVIVNSEVMCGVMDKQTVGEGRKNSVFGVLLRDYGPDAAIQAMNRLAKMCARWLTNKGFSLGINDVMPGENLRKTKEIRIRDAYEEAASMIEKAKHGQLDNMAGASQEETLESNIQGKLSDVRQKCADACMEELSRHNAPLIMAYCGSKGSPVNVAQMVACVGQQVIAGSRVPNGFQDRSLPHFPKKSKDPPAKGFVSNSFYTGLTPTEFLFHAISGREGLVDTAVKTAETGYMARRLMKALEDLSVHYDKSVRNSAGGMVQFEYGTDALDPAELEGNALPVEYRRTWRHSKAVAHQLAKKKRAEEAAAAAAAAAADADALMAEADAVAEAEADIDGEPGIAPFEMEEILQAEMTSKRWQTDTNEAYIAETVKFVRENVIQPAANLRASMGLEPALEKPEDWDPAVHLFGNADEAARAVLDNKTKITRTTLQHFLTTCYDKFIRAKVEPGTAVGAIGAQSIGEPGTQMTLKTFHFAGLASMNITQGVPRIKEIINAAKVISTPIVRAPLVNQSSEAAARVTKGRIEKTYLGDIASEIEEAWTDDSAFVLVHVDEKAINMLQLELTLSDIKWAIVKSRLLKLKDEQIHINERDFLLRINLNSDDAQISYILKTLQRGLPHVIVKGIHTATRAVITIDKGQRHLGVEGQGLLEIMGTDGVDFRTTRTNHVMEMEKVLGIEAARKSIYDEIQETMKSHSMNIDPRHVMLLADVMTYKGQVLGITRFGVAKMKDSVLMLASFEKTTDHLFDAALFGKTDAIEGVSESIIMGHPAEGLGTGLGGMRTAAVAATAAAARRLVLLPTSSTSAAAAAASPALPRRRTMATSSSSNGNAPARKPSRIVGKHASRIHEELSKGIDVWTLFGAGFGHTDNVNLGQGFMNFPPPVYVREAITSALNDRVDVHHYAHAKGIPRLRNAIADFYSASFRKPADEDKDVWEPSSSSSSSASSATLPRRRPDAGIKLNPDTDIVVTPGANQGMYCILAAFLEPGDEVITFEPAFDQYHCEATFNNGKPVYVPFIPPTQGAASNKSGPQRNMPSANDWAVDWDALEKAMASPKAKAIIYNSPHNPLGKVYTEPELARLAALCIKYDLLVLADEVYDCLTYDGIEHIRLANFEGMWERTITIGSAGKSFAATGWRVGWCIGPAHLVQPTWTVHVRISFCTNHAASVGAAIGLEQAAQHNFFPTQVQQYAERRDILCKALDDVGLPYSWPEGGYFVMVDGRGVEVPQDFELPAEIAKRPKDFHIAWFLASKIGITTIPASAFYSDEHALSGEGYIRFSFCKDGDLERAAERLERLRPYLKKN